MGIKGTEIKNFAKFIQKNRVLSNILRKKIVENISARYLICGNKNDKIVVDTLKRLNKTRIPVCDKARARVLRTLFSPFSASFFLVFLFN